MRQGRRAGLPTFRRLNERRRRLMYESFHIIAHRDAIHKWRSNVREPQIVKRVGRWRTCPNQGLGFQLLPRVLLLLERKHALNHDIVDNESDG
jgi:hypothetical protein